MKISVATTISAPINKVWRTYTTPEDIKQWNAASDDWHTTAASVDLREGGKFSSRMEAKDGSMGFDFSGTYTKVVEPELIEYSTGRVYPRPDGYQSAGYIRQRIDLFDRAAAPRLAVYSR